MNMTFSQRFKITTTPLQKKKYPKTQASLAQRAIATACPHFVLYVWGILATACECSLSAWSASVVFWNDLEPLWVVIKAKCVTNISQREYIYSWF